MNYSKSEIELYFVDVVAVHEAPNCQGYQIYIIDFDEEMILPLDNRIYESREQASSFIKEYEYFQISYEALNEELRRYKVTKYAGSKTK